MANPYPINVSLSILMNNLEGLLILKQCYESDNYYQKYREIFDTASFNCPLCELLKDKGKCNSCVWGFQFPEVRLEPCFCFFKHSIYRSFNVFKWSYGGAKAKSSARARRMSILKKQIKWTKERISQLYPRTTALSFPRVKNEDGTLLVLTFSEQEV